LSAALKHIPCQLCFRQKPDSGFTQNVNIPVGFTFFVNKNAPPGHRNGMLFGRNRGHIIIIYPAFTGFPVADASFFIISLRLFHAKAVCGAFSAKTGMRYASNQISGSFRNPGSSSHPLGDVFVPGPPSAPGTTCSGLPDTDLTAPLFSVFLGGAVFLTFL
jgi:hypothetical protein